MTNQLQIYKMVARLLKADPQSDFVWRQYPQIATAVVAASVIGLTACDAQRHEPPALGWQSLLATIPDPIMQRPPEDKEKAK